MTPGEEMARAAVCAHCAAGRPVVRGPLGSTAQAGHEDGGAGFIGWVACEYETTIPIRPISGPRLAQLMDQAYERGAREAAR